MVEAEPDSCTRCGADWRKLSIERCDGCPAAALEEELEGPAGRVVRRAFDLHWAAEKGMVRLADLTAEEFRLLRSIDELRPDPAAKSERR